MKQGPPHPGPATREPWPGWAGDPLSLTAFDADPRQVAELLLGKLLVSVKDGVAAGGRIVETEAYLGRNDPGSHAATQGMTPRNATMYGPPAHTYVYFTYGNHHMLNLVSDIEGNAGGVLIRGLEPLLGLDVMVARRRGRAGLELTNGPGKLAQALGIDLG
ncbi:MAG: DNA-3-methyladenine glycosylase, partial [Coriobacteriia bacterium]